MINMPDNTNIETIVNEPLLIFNHVTENVWASTSDVEINDFIRDYQEAIKIAETARKYKLIVGYMYMIGVWYDFGVQKKNLKIHGPELWNFCDKIQEQISDRY